MTSLFESLMTEAAPTLMESLGNRGAVRIESADGLRIRTHDAILGVIRVETEEDFEGRETKIERIEIDVLVGDWTPEKNASVYVATDNAAWSVDSFETTGVFVRLRLSRPWLMRQSRGGYERHGR